MRYVAFVVAVCLVLSPMAYAGDQAVSDLEPGSFWTDLWETVLTLPMLILGKSSTAPEEDGTGVDPSVEPPQTDAGPMIIVNG